MLAAWRLGRHEGLRLAGHKLLVQWQHVPVPVSVGHRAALSEMRISVNAS